MSDLYTIFEKNIEQNQDDPFLFFKERTLSWREVGKIADSVALKLLNLNVSPTDRVGIYLPNCPEYLSILFGILKIGGVAVPLNTYLKYTELDSIIDNSGISVLFTSSNFIDEIENSKTLSEKLEKIIVLGEFNFENDIYESFSNVIEIDDDKLVNPSISVKSSDTALIIYTSGTTATAKGVELTHRNLISNLQSIDQFIDVSCEDWFLLFLPMFHSFTITTTMLLPMYLSSKIVIQPSFHPGEIVRNIMKYPISLFLGIPALYNMMVDEKFNIPDRIFKKIRYFISGSAPLSIPVLEKFEQKFGTPILEGYGLSEASPVVSLNPPDGVKKGSVGIPIPGVSVAIISEEGNHLKEDVIGEIAVSGDNVMKGYFNNPEETKRALENSWLQTGDLGYIDNDRFIHVVSRKKELIIVAGTNVYPREIEEVLLQNTNLEEAAVIGTPDSVKGELPVAFIKLKENMQTSDDELKMFCRERLATFKVPCHFEFVDEFPRNSTGKILKRALKYPLS